MTFIPSLENIVSTVNSSTTPLSAAGVFTGTSVDTGEYSTITVSAYSDQSGTLSIQFSSNGTDWDISQEYPITANTGFTETTNIGAQFFRIQFTNEAVAQTIFRLQSILTTGKTPNGEPFTGLTNYRLVSTLNSTTTPLSSSTTFTGSGEESIYPEVLVSVNTDQVGTLFIDYSLDNSTWVSSSFSGYRIEPNITIAIKETIKNRYYRVRLVNGSVAQTNLLISSIVGAFDEEFVTNTQQIIRKNTGLQPDTTPFTNVGYALSLTTTYQDIWGITGVMVLPTGSESYEIVSDNVNDTGAGTGAQQVYIETLDANGLIQSQTVTLNGTTAVALTGTHTFPRVMVVSDSGSNFTNIGTITLRVSGAGNTRGVIEADVGKSLDSHYKVPSNMEFYLTNLDFHTGVAAKEVVARSRTMAPGTNTWVSTSILPFGSQSFTRDFSESSARYIGGTIIKFDAKVSTGSGDDVTVILSGIERRIN